eukprot:scaffold33608_cov76-Amphora_coffeaeformis.AAC.1
MLGRDAETRQDEKQEKGVVIIGFAEKLISELVAARISHATDDTNKIFYYEGRAKTDDDETTERQDQIDSVAKSMKKGLYEGVA